MVNKRFKTTCVVNNYNYEKYVVEAIISATRQSIDFDEIIVVDDGSTDSSPEILKKHFADDIKIKLIFKENEGQLSCFRDGYLASTGDIIFFLDSDDIYHENYLEESLKFYERYSECDFLFCAHEDFGNFGSKIRRKHAQDGDIGYSVILAAYSDDYIAGNVTSTLSMKRWILDKIFPLSLTKEFRVRADDCLVFGSSLVGARKFYCTSPLVKRRLHGQNDSLKYDKLNANIYYRYKRQLNLNRLRDLMFQKMNYGTRISPLIHLEFRSIKCPSFFIFKLYLSIIVVSPNMSLYQKLASSSVIFEHFLIFSVLPKLRKTFAQERV